MQVQQGNHSRFITTVLACMFLVACAGTQNRHTDPVNDPWEGFNRKVHSFNMTLDRNIARPVARTYKKVTPKPFQRGFSNFFRNLDYPVTLINQVLQGKFRDGGRNTGRFLVNSTIGLLGFFDVASRMGIPEYDEDFGQTLAKWGYEDSRYLVLPFFGPSTFRDGIGQSFYGYAHPVSYVAREDHWYTPMVLDLVQTRAAFLNQDQTLEEAFDPYTLVRDAWLQNREFKIYDGDPPVPDYEDMLEELEAQ
ncbi:MAG: VacJ family lipoprotein [Xanthomonadales bacterium]|nr:VacJ family lipoprotein [Gammaproteobacteria bacterium]NNE05247.1 VacJ family lipoprotein [Xanthomonadales bacterium]NNL94166.1 VacJ family lipoprotein [Xanthomonadales bacterium]